MSVVRSQVTVQVRSGDPLKDYTVNVVHHTIDTGIVWGDPDYQNHANQVRDAFVNGHASDGFPVFGVYTNRVVTVKVYALADAEPRPVKAISVHTPAVMESAQLGPRSIALCLSFYSDRNLPSTRGRIYIGPWLNSAMGEVPAVNFQQELLNLGHALFDVGGENVSHTVWSPTHQSTSVVKHYWCNDVWDVVHSRLPKELHREQYAP